MLRSVLGTVRLEEELDLAGGAPGVIFVFLRSGAECEGLLGMLIPYTADIDFDTGLPGGGDKMCLEELLVLEVLFVVLVDIDTTVGGLGEGGGKGCGLFKKAQ